MNLVHIPSLEGRIEENKFFSKPGWVFMYQAVVLLSSSVASHTSGFGNSIELML